MVAEKKWIMAAIKGSMTTVMDKMMTDTEMMAKVLGIMITALKVTMSIMDILVIIWGIVM